MLIELVSIVLAAHSTARLTAGDILSQYGGYEAMALHVAVLDPSILELCTTSAATAMQGPHAVERLSVFMNPAAASTLRDAVRPKYPVGSIVVKRKEHDDGSEVAIGGMVKREAGYDPTNGDWEYFYAESGRAPESGRLETCSGCHARAADSDHVFGDWGSPVRQRLTE